MKGKRKRRGRKVNAGKLNIRKCIIAEKKLTLVKKNVTTFATANDNFFMIIAG